MAGTLYLIPVTIADGALQSLPAEVFETTINLKHYFVENVRTARRFLKSLHADLHIEPVLFSEMNKHDGLDFPLLKEWLKQGFPVGIMSEAGCPGVADPGSELVAVAHEVGAKVVPLVGPSSLMLALMASGMNGQSFAFQGYLPVKDPARSARIKQLEQISKKDNQTQLFIETPYRNNPMLAELLKNCQSGTKICIAQNLTAPNAFVKTATVKEWQKAIPHLEKAPAVFLLLA